MTHGCRSREADHLKFDSAEIVWQGFAVLRGPGEAGLGEVREMASTEFNADLSKRHTSRGARFAFACVLLAVATAACGSASETKTVTAASAPSAQGTATNAASQGTATNAESQGTATNAASQGTATNAASQGTATNAASQGTATNAASQRTATSATSPRASSKPKHRTRTAPNPTATTTPNWVTTSGNSQTTTIPANPAAPKYVGPSPINCLELAGLNRARPAPEPEVWIANSPSSATNNHDETVFLSGPYHDSVSAEQYAHSLLVVELAASGGRWVASAAVHSGLRAAVTATARCMASG
jgi:hypothetical protein